MTALKIKLFDSGQDFYRFVLRDGQITEANLQGWLWNGKKVVNRDVKVGDLITFDDGKWLRYPVVAVESVTNE